MPSHGSELVPGRSPWTTAISCFGLPIWSFQRTLCCFPFTAPTGLQRSAPFRDQILDDPAHVRAPVSGGNSWSRPSGRLGFVPRRSTNSKTGWREFSMAWSQVTALLRARSPGRSTRQGPSSESCPGSAKKLKGRQKQQRCAFDGYPAPRWPREDHESSVRQLRTATAAVTDGSRRSLGGCGRWSPEKHESVSLVGGGRSVRSRRHPRVDWP